MNNLQYFHILSTQESICLDKVSKIIWNNKKSRNRIYTSVELGTSIAASDGYGVCKNEQIILCDKDRERFYKTFELLTGKIPFPLELNDSETEN